MTHPDGPQDRIVIERIKIRNFKCLRNSELVPTPGLNIIAGDNDSGKSSILEAISLVLTGRVDGRRATEQINPYWFNLDAVREFFAAWPTQNRIQPPSIEIEAYFAQEPAIARLQGKRNSRTEDLPGLKMVIELDDQFTEEFAEYMENVPVDLLILPVEFFRARWVDFCEIPVVRRPKELGSTLIDSMTARRSATLDWHTTQIIKGLVDSKIAALMSVQYRSDRVAMTSAMLTTLNSRLGENDEILQLEAFRLGADLDTGGWETTLVPHVGEAPLQFAGLGQQVMVKASLAMRSSRDRTAFVLLEEPENHLSHTNLTKLLDTVERLADGRQCFVTTHSSYVLNRLGLDKLHLLHHGRLAQFEDLSDDTTSYFKKQPGFDSLRTVLATKIVLVEGPSDEMLFIRAYLDRTGREPRADGIDVICYGIQNRRPLELCAALDKPAVVLRDNDGKQKEHWEGKANGLLSEKRRFFIGDPAKGATLEPQLVHANDSAPRVLQGIVGCPDGSDLVGFMTSEKTESAWRIATSNQKIQYPDYINEAIEHLRN